MRTYRLAALTSALTSALSVLSFAAVPLPYAHAQDYACAVPAHIGVEELPPADPSLALLRQFATGAGVRVAVIDTGIAPTAELDQVIPGHDFIDPWAPATHLDCDSHGTVVAGIIAGTSRGIAPDAEILNIRQSSAYYRTPLEGGEEAPGAGSLQTLTDAIHHALDEHASVINISVVSCIPQSVAARLDTSGIEHALARAEAEGAVVVAAAGNASPKCEQGYAVIPAHSPTVIAVGALDADYGLADYSIIAPSGAVAAPGFVEVALASDGSGWATGTWATEGLRPYTGTSFAAPVVSGAIALLRERYPYLTPAQIRDMVWAAAEPNWGAIDPLVLLSMLPPPPEPAPEFEYQPVVIEPAEHPVHHSSRRWSRMVLALVFLSVAGICAPRAREATYAQYGIYV
ncbi:S8 family serine peptidase [Corynebacterium aquatimens]|uniref:S8 family serine peptidase n=1 Tax=Corynebacterium TaxID=1716 RepID=UPI001F273A10|nr:MULTISPECIES: S8 family serine peptidase [Corynebacterium]QYH20233.1 S8 family serine peptidase [Corynebacterium aquatimens]UIZ92503.1 S8 family serine peptidase [Corynebacterium sp. CNCTC7651]